MWVSNPMITAEVRACLVVFPDPAPPEYSIGGLTCRYWLRA
jgi:hypothetical protein